MLDRAKFEGKYTETDEFDWQAITSRELGLIKLYRLMSAEDQNHLRRMSEILVEAPRSSDVDRKIS